MEREPETLEIIPEAETGAAPPATPSRSPGGGAQRCTQCSSCPRCSSTSPAFHLSRVNSATSSEHSGDTFALRRDFTVAFDRTQTNRDRMETDFKIIHLEKGQRAVGQEVQLDDLTATWDDQQIHGKDVQWNQCWVSDPLWSQLTELQRAQCKKAADERRMASRSITADPSAPGGSPRGPRRRFLSSSVPTRGSSESLLPVGPALAPEQDRSCHPPSIVAAARAEDAARGAHGIVYRAKWKGSLKVAIKVQQKEDDNTEETRLFMDLRHPHLVACYGILQHDGKRSIVTERCTTSLSAFLRTHSRWQSFHNEQLTPEQIDLCKYTILEHVSQGLQKLHDMSVLHKDLKCENVLLDGDPGECEHCHHSGTWKICDFGEAKILETPVLSFLPRQPWAEDFDHRRFVKVQAESLRNLGARFYCWLHPGETKATAAGNPPGPYSSVEGQRRLERELRAIGTGKSWRASEVAKLKARATEEGLTQSDFEALAHAAGARALNAAEEVAPGNLKLSEAQRQTYLHETDPRPDEIIAAVLRHHNPYPHGALVYSFSEDPEHRHPDDCVFAVASPLGSSSIESPPPVSSSPLQGQQSREMEFPCTLKAFNLIPAAELNNDLLHHVVVDLQKNTYRITRPLRPQSMCPQVSTLLSLYSDAVKGKISRPHPIQSASALDRRRQRIPERTYFLRYSGFGVEINPPLQATHYVFAYQLPNWSTDHLTAEELKGFDMYSGEISLASYGGFIYLNMDGEHIPTGWDSHYPHYSYPCARVVGVNALSMGPRTPYPGGVVACPDQRITGRVASPELWLDSNVGLETDVYAFGIIMWEVFTRRQAWHWRGGEHDMQIKWLVAKEHRRPKIPKGMVTECADMIRKCLHANPGKRPDAKELTDWIRERRDKLQMQIRRQRAAAVRECDMKRHSSAETHHDAGKRQTQWSIIDRSYEAAKCWHYGKYSQHYITTTPNRKGAESDGSVNLTVNDYTVRDWEERALTDEFERYRDEQHQENSEKREERQTLGIKFDLVNEYGSKENHWPTITRVELCDENGKQTLASQFPEIQVGCKIIEINGEPVPSRIKDAAPMFKDRPLQLKFSAPAHHQKRLQPWATAQWPSAERSDLPTWIQGGLRAIDQVADHEAKMAAVADHEAKMAAVAEHEAKMAATELSQARAEIADLRRQLEAARAAAVSQGESTNGGAV